MEHDRPTRMVHPSQQIELRSLGPDDWRVWRSLRLRALQDAPYAFSSRLADWKGEHDREARWRERLTSVPFNLIAVLDDVPVGMASGTELDAHRTVELISMWVAPAARGRGVADALMDAVVEWARTKEAARVGLIVTEGNLHAVALYQRHGFVDAGPNPVASPEDAPERRFVLPLKA